MNESVGRNPNAAPITLGSFTYSAGLGAGLSYTRTERFTIPRLTGSWRVEVVTNSGNSLYEYAAASGNNRTLDDTAMTLSVNPRPDLQVEALQVPARVTAGGTVQVSFDVVNRGSVAATGQWQDSVWLSLDSKLDSGDFLIGSLANLQALDTDEHYRSVTGALQIPIRLIGVGEGVEDLQDFNAEAFVAALFRQTENRS